MSQDAWLSEAENAPGLANLLREGGNWEQVAPVGFAFAVAMLARQAQREKRRLWVFFEETRHQELVDAELEWWCGTRPLLFPALPPGVNWDILPDPDLLAARAETMRLWRKEKGGVILAHEHSWSDDLPEPDKKAAHSLDLAAGDEPGVDTLLDRFQKAGFALVPQVIRRGQYARRGGILDVFGWNMRQPLRLEFFDDQIESLRYFDVHSQTSTESTKTAGILLKMDSERRDFRPLSEDITPGDRVAHVGSKSAPMPVHWQICSGRLRDEGAEDFSLAVFEKPAGEWLAGDFVMRAARRQEFLRLAARWQKPRLIFHNQGEEDRFHEVEPPSKEPRWQILHGPIHHGFEFRAAGFVALAAAEIFGRYQHLRTSRLEQNVAPDRLTRARQAARELQPGNLVVHADHGIARYLGFLKRVTPDGLEEEVLELEFEGDARLYVPLPYASLVSRYASPGISGAPRLNKLGDTRWNKTRQAAKASIQDYAKKLMQIAADRETLVGAQHPPDTPWQQEFEASFLYRETPDQLRAIAEVKADMERPRPMDRLICGDAGFGKTEVAVRAVFKCVAGGRQALFLAPTTVLAQQHYEHIRQRFSDYPMKVEWLSRFVTPAKQQEVVKGLADGSVDVVVGTHRLVSADIAPKNPGLVIIDEEQRFGVEHKERFRERFRTVDVLTLSATPIPRTLYLSLMGARDYSALDTPPITRLPVETILCQYDEDIVGTAILQELDRNGQVFYLHNRVKTIERTALKLRQLCPKARIGIGHGQMPERDLENVMSSFISGELDILVCTTIIESGVDIPNANTIIIDRADMFGLADLYQLRGRVGRADRKARAILMLPGQMIADSASRKRLNAIRQYSDLGSGFHIAMRDLEIRGVGNLLGTEQSGHMHGLGFDLYCQILKTAVEELKTGKAVKREISIRSTFLCWDEREFLKREQSSKLLPAFLPANFIPDPAMRLEAYRDLSAADKLRAVDNMKHLWRDRFGVLPDPASNLIMLARMRMVASAKGVDSIEIQGDKLILQRGGGFVQIDGRFPRLTAASPAAKVELAFKLLQKL